MRRSLFYLLMTTTTAFALPASFQEGMRLKNAQQLTQAEMVFKQLVARNQDDIAALEQLAIIESWLNHYDESIAVWNRVIQLEPHRPGAQIGLARVSYWKGDRGAALHALDIALQQTPNDYDALVLQGDVLLAEGKIAAARHSYLQAQRIDDGASSQELDRKLANAVEPPHWRVDAGGASDHYTNERGTEGSGYLQLAYNLTPHAGMYFHYDRLGEFGQIDQSYLLGGYSIIGSSVLLAAEAGATPDAYFRPSQQVTAGIELLASQTIQPLLGYRYMHYDTRPIPDIAGVPGKGDVNTITPGMRAIFHDVGNLEVRYGYTHNIDKSNTGVAQARFNIDTIGKLTPYVAIAHGKEALPPQLPATFTVYSVGSVYEFTPCWSARVDLAYENRPEFYNHSTVAAGISAHF